MFKLKLEKVIYKGEKAYKILGWEDSIPERELPEKYLKKGEMFFFTYRYYNSGDWHYYRFEQVLEFNSKEEAEKFITEQEDIYVLGRLDSEGKDGLFIDWYRNCENVFTQPSLYTVLYVGTKEECEARMEKLLKDYEEEE